MTLTSLKLEDVYDVDSDSVGSPSPVSVRRRSKVPMISVQLQMREVRRRVLSLCVKKLETIRDSEKCLRRSVCINNTFLRLSTEIRREKQNKMQMLQHFKNDKTKISGKNNENENNNGAMNAATVMAQKPNSAKVAAKRTSSSVEADLERLDRELADAAMPLCDPVMLQSAEQLEQAMVSKKRKPLSSEEENDRLVREALSHFYLPTTRLLTGIEDFVLPEKRPKLDFNQNQKDFDFDSVLGVNECGDSCSQAAKLEEHKVAFRNLMLPSLET